MRYRILLALLLIPLLSRVNAQTIDPQYHTNEEIYEKIMAWQDTLPDYVKVETIGYSHEDQLPIWAVKLSTNVQVDQDQPTVLFVGNIHAEELIGVEITMAMMEDILIHRYMGFPTPYRDWLLGLEMWFVPTLNPEGHQVVMDEWDTSYRKNKHDCNNDGLFTYSTVSTGNDTDGVDLNRNFPLNWAHGYEYLEIGNAAEPYDYFRGFVPLEESECQAIWNLGLREKFSFSIFYHASRTTNFSEKVFYPWEWSTGKTPPDFSMINDIGVTMAGLIHKTTSQTYLPVPTASRAGNQHDSFYAYQGTFAYLIEAGPYIQNAYSLVLEIITENKNGAYYLLNKAAGVGGENTPQITGLVTDANTGQPLEAEVIVLEKQSPYFQPRTCEPEYGRYRRLLPQGTYNLEVRMRGYEPQTALVVVNPGSPSTRNFSLVPKPIHYFHGLVKEIGDDPIGCTMYILGEDVCDTVTVGSTGEFSMHLPEGDYELIFDNPDYVVRFDAFTLDANRYIEFELSPAFVAFSDGFEDGLSRWETNGTDPYLVRWDTEPADSLWAGGMVATESPDAEYLPEVDNWMQLANPIDLSNQLGASVRFEHWYYFEPGYDSCWVEASEDGGTNWDVIAGPFWGQDIGWGTGYADLTPYCGSDQVLVRFHIATDANLEEEGWRIDDVIVAAADTVDTVIYDPNYPANFVLHDAFPNPFNAELSILLRLSHREAVDISIWDIGGRKIDQIYIGELETGPQRLSWRPDQNRSTGLYFLRIESDTRSVIQKVLYLK